MDGMETIKLTDALMHVFFGTDHVPTRTIIMGLILCALAVLPFSPLGRKIYNRIRGRKGQLTPEMIRFVQDLAKGNGDSYSFLSVSLEGIGPDTVRVGYRPIDPTLSMHYLIHQTDARRFLSVANFEMVMAGWKFQMVGPIFVGTPPLRIVPRGPSTTKDEETTAEITH